jgi:hypothetical protein
MGRNNKLTYIKKIETRFDHHIMCACAICLLFIPSKLLKMSLYHKYKSSPNIYDNSYCTTLNLPTSPDRKSLYSSIQDDHFIDRNSGKPLYISGYYLCGSDEYAIINRAVIPFFNPQSGDLRLLSKPFIMNTNTFKQVSVQDLIDLNIITSEYAHKIQSFIDTTHINYQECPEVQLHGGLPSYISFLKNMYDHIVSVANTCPY